MKKLAFLALTVATFAFGFARAEIPQPVEVMVGINEAFIPDGLTPNTDAGVIVTGIFQNGCYKWSRAEVKEVSRTEHEVRTFATVNPGLCIMVLVPYQKQVKLGQLDAGVHHIRFVNGDGTYLDKTFEVQ